MRVGVARLRGQTAVPAALGQQPSRPPATAAFHIWSMGVGRLLPESAEGGYAATRPAPARSHHVRAVKECAWLAAGVLPHRRLGVSPLSKRAGLDTGWSPTTCSDYAGPLPREPSRVSGSVRVLPRRRFDDGPALLPGAG